MLNNKYRAHIHADVADAVRAAAHEWVVLAAQAIAARGGFHVALSGGTTPRALYECLASAEFSAQIDWPRVHIWFGDERAVPPQHPDSNYRMAHDALLCHVPVLPAHIHRMQGEQDNVHDAATAYQAQLAACLSLSGSRPDPMQITGVPQFDLMLLGLGPDGHVASLFPETPILTERTRWVAAVFVEKLNAWRISLTLPVINNARYIMVLVAGAGKAEIVGEIFSARTKTSGRYPVEMIHSDAIMNWYLDAAAAQYITEKDPS